MILSQKIQIVIKLSKAVSQKKYFFALAHTLCAIAGCTKCLLDSKQFKQVLLGKLNNNVIEIYFCLMRSIPEDNMA